VLGGVILAEAVRNNQGVGVRLRTSFYLNGQRIARDGGAGGSIEYEHTNPINGSWLVTNGHPYWRMMDRQERDPFGADMSRVWQSVSFASLNEGGYPDDWRGGCEIDGAQALCSMISSENAQQCPKNDCSPRRGQDGRPTQPFQAFANGWGGFLPEGTHYIGDGRYASPGPPGDRREGQLERDDDYVMTFGGDLDLSGPQNTQNDPCADQVLQEFSLRDDSGMLHPYINSRAASDFQAALDDINQAIPGGIAFSRAFRTRKEQEDLWAKRHQNPNPVAHPGTSRHEGGFAVDISGIAAKGPNGR